MIIVLAIAAWIVLSVPLALLMGRLLAGPGRRRSRYAVTAGSFTPAPTQALGTPDEQIRRTAC